MLGVQRAAQHLAAFSFVHRSLATQLAMAMLLALSALVVGASAQTQFANKPLKVGETVPSVELDFGFGPPSKINLAERVAGKKVILVGLPGAFTPT